MVGSWTMLFSVSFLRPRKVWSLTNSLNLSLNAAFPSRVRNEPWPFSFTPTTNGPYFVPSSRFRETVPRTYSSGSSASASREAVGRSRSIWVTWSGSNSHAASSSAARTSLARRQLASSIKTTAVTIALAQEGA